MRRVLRLHILRRGKSSPGSGSFVDSVFFAQLSSSGVGAWSNTSSYPLKAQSPSCVTASGYVYCVGGYTAENPYNSVGSVFYARVTSSGVGAWSNTTPYPTPHGQASCVAGAGYIYCAGNSGHGRAPINSSGVGVWTNVGYPGPGGPPACDTYEITAFGYLYCIGGMTSSQPSAFVYYAPVNYTSSDDWLRTADYPVPVTGESCVSSNGYVYCVAGSSSGGEVNSAYFSQILHPLVSGKPMNTWLADQGARLSSPPPIGMPAGIQLPDGRIRLYFCQQVVKPSAPGPPGPPPPNSQAFVIRSAISRDGLNFTAEPGIRINGTATRVIQGSASAILQS